MQPTQSNFSFVQASVSLIREVSRCLPFAIPGAENITTIFLTYRNASRATQQLGQIIPNELPGTLNPEGLSQDHIMANFLRGRGNRPFFDRNSVFTGFQRVITPIWQEMTLEKGMAFLKGLGMLADTALSQGLHTKASDFRSDLRYRNQIVDSCLFICPFYRTYRSTKPSLHADRSRRSN